MKIIVFQSKDMYGYWKFQRRQQDFQENIQSNGKLTNFYRSWSIDQSMFCRVTYPELPTWWPSLWTKSWAESLLLGFVHILARDSDVI